MNGKSIVVLAVLTALYCLCACGAAGGTLQNSREKTETGVEGINETAEQGAAISENNPAAYDSTAADPALDDSGAAATNTTAEEINCWGDSITEGYGSDGVTYPEALEALTGMPVRNLGIGGEDSVAIAARCRAYGSQEEDILVIQMGDNGGWKDLDELVDQYRDMISEAGTERYIIISSTDDPDDFEQIWGYTTQPVGLADTPYEAKFREVFGEHLLVGRKFLIEHGLAINGLEETEEDRLRARKGSISLQFRNPEIDNTHLNEYGYIALAHGVYAKGKALGYWD